GGPRPRRAALSPPGAPPTRPSSTAAITVLVSGATVTAIPVPTTTMAGKNVVQYEPPAPGSAQRRKPIAVITGPVTSGRRAPKRSISPPAQRDSPARMRANGRYAAPVVVAV